MLSHRQFSDTLYLQVRTAFIAKGGSLHAWCRENGVAMPNARAALLGEWTGPKASTLAEQIICEAGLDD